MMTSDPVAAARCGGEGEAGLFRDADLVDAVELDLGRILDRADVVRVPIEHLQRAIERQRLAAPVGPVTSTRPCGARIAASIAA
jgi:hypothetical protein